MPSDTAFLSSITATDRLVDANYSLGEATDEVRVIGLSRASRPDISPRFLMGVIANLSALGIEIGENNRVLNAIRAGVITNYSLYMLWSAHRSLVIAETGRKTVLATAEAVALAAAQQWQMLAMGAAAATLVYSAFEVGGKFGSGEWNLPPINFAKPSDRRAASRYLRDIRG